MSKSSNKVAKWDVRFGIKDEDISTILSPNDLIEIFKSCCKQWGFQLEEGDGGLIHYQGRINLISQARKAQVLEMFNDAFSEYDENLINYFHISPLSKNCIDKGQFYQYSTKLQSRIDGPWSDKDKCTKVMTTQLTHFRGLPLRPYQLKLKEIIENHKNNPDFRKIYFIQDKIGSIGKSLFAEYLEYEGLAEELPLMNSMEDISCWIASTMIDKDGNKIGDASNCYLIDIPRSKNEDKIGGFLAGIEHLKDGKAFDKRYKSRKVRFNRPCIICFCNSFPQSFEGLTLNRWMCYEITEQYDLKHWDMCPNNQKLVIDEEEPEVENVIDEEEPEVENVIDEEEPEVENVIEEQPKVQEGSQSDDDEDVENNIKTILGLLETGKLAFNTDDNGVKKCKLCINENGSISQFIPDKMDRMV
jgi:hypothetical protein